ncbi:uncharacterized protein DUF397 [Micromonospora violae]|uniref:Uncharacterized protein DUF397 n=1 Tax=Micromonospora violae TaxID=1278207 RepID=A0A4Q7UA51_9ACTN|nr:DUF397 domain-containing protein [Micromonospora violae]RZT76988.1 uncharacterized protein DUF397 [Micromonospora violae]
METTDRMIWRKPSYSDNNGGACIEVAALGTSITVRDSKDPSGSTLRFTTGAWTSFLRTIR